MWVDLAQSALIKVTWEENKPWEQRWLFSFLDQASLGSAGHLLGGRDRQPGLENNTNEPKNMMLTIPKCTSWWGHPNRKRQNPEEIQLMCESQRPKSELIFWYPLPNKPSWMNEWMNVFRVTLKIGPWLMNELIYICMERNTVSLHLWLSHCSKSFTDSNKKGRVWLRIHTFCYCVF